MHASTEQFIELLDRKGLTYECIEGQADSEDERERNDVVKIPYGGDNLLNILVVALFDENNKDVAIRTSDFVKGPASKQEAMLAAVNEQNREYRFVKFCLDTDDNTIHAEADALLSADNVGEVCYELVGHTLVICDSAYPSLMKAVWS